MLRSDLRQVILEVQQFSPEEITVKTVGNQVIVEAKHEERQDEHGFVSRHFVRRYVLPPSHDVFNITSSLSSDGVLTITAPKKVRDEEEEEVLSSANPRMDSRSYKRLTKCDPLSPFCLFLFFMYALFFLIVSIPTVPCVPPLSRSSMRLEKMVCRRLISISNYESALN